MAAALRLPRSMSAREKEAAADALIRRLGLTGSADTPVGGNWRPAKHCCWQDIRAVFTLHTVRPTCMCSLMYTAGSR